ncbi:hypothetical protein F4554_005553 [Actinopolymorpha rutila]|uniref:Uncharacterized protein n=1 Tax=Actinopolymorpha rutila TaxID=446787 RepID=A0A852ZLB8_9ACTN|nr:hypothetical protein [Actinopolymorpha rutila]
MLMDPEQSGDDLRRQINEAAAEAARDVAAARQARPEIAVWWEDLSNAEFVQRVSERMNAEQAETIRRWRKTGTWREVAKECYEAYLTTWGIGWTMPGHQEVGQLICNAAARRLDENPRAEPWN